MLTSGKGSHHEQEHDARSTIVNIVGVWHGRLTQQVGIGPSNRCLDDEPHETRPGSKHGACSAACLWEPRMPRTREPVEKECCNRSVFMGSSGADDMIAMALNSS